MKVNVYMKYFLTEKTSDTFKINGYRKLGFRNKKEDGVTYYILNKTFNVRVDHTIEDMQYVYQFLRKLYVSVKPVRDEMSYWDLEEIYQAHQYIHTMIFRLREIELWYVSDHIYPPTDGTMYVKKYFANHYVTELHKFQNVKLSIEVSDIEEMPKEKRKPLSPVLNEEENKYQCPDCGEQVYKTLNGCPNCKRQISWRGIE